MSPTHNEAIAAQATLAPLGDYVMRVGMHKGLGDYSKPEIDGLVKTILDAYHTRLQALYEEDIPF